MYQKVYNFLNKVSLLNYDTLCPLLISRECFQFIQSIPPKGLKQTVVLPTTVFFMKNIGGRFFIVEM